MKTKLRTGLVGILLSTQAMANTTSNETKLLRFPSVHKEKIVFTYAGDLYLNQKGQNVARRLTSHVGTEIFSKFSPDGKNIAFTGQYDGNTEVYVMPSEGGDPKRLTYTATLGRDDVSDRMGPNNIVLGWKDNETIILRSRRVEHNSFKGQLYTININGGDLEQIPVPHGGWISFEDGKKRFAYNRIFREFRTWKRYRGGQADDIWIYDLSSKNLENITNSPSQDIFPMWNQDKVYYISDRLGRDEVRKMNLYSYDLLKKTTTQLTFFKEFDIKFPSLGKEQIIFENGGMLYTFSLVNQKLEKHTIYVKNDLNVSRPEIISVSDNIQSYGLSPKANRILVGARGELFTLPSKEGPVRNITQTSGIHERSPTWSPDGKYIAYISDETGEDEIWLKEIGKSQNAIQLTKDSKNYKFWMSWSPDGKKLIWTDRKHRLRMVNIKSKKIKTIFRSDRSVIWDFSWSPDSMWIAFNDNIANRISQIKIYSLKTGKINVVTEKWFSARRPEFTDDGKFMIYSSDREFNPTRSSVETNFSYNNMTKLFIVPLENGIKTPFAYKSDEVVVGDKKKIDKDEKKKNQKVKVNIDFDGLIQRAELIPVDASTYWNIESVGMKVHFSKWNFNTRKSDWYLYDLEEEKETLIAKGIEAYSFSSDKQFVLVKKDNNLYRIKAPVSEVKLEKPISISNLKINLKRKKEWEQIFHESWRQMRDFFYDENMHGVDWELIKKRYKELLPHVNHRIDLTYIIGEMIGELNTGHAYVGGGDYPKANRIPLGLLGAELQRDKKSGFYKIKEILKGQNWNSSLRSPLTENGVKAQVGNYIIAVDGINIKNSANIFEFLVDKAGKQVTLTLNTSASKKGSWDIIIKPIADEHALYYHNWVIRNIELVSKLSDGKIGYIHIPDMGIDGLNQFTRYFFSQLDKKALIIDDRGNGGGFVSPVILEKLRRQLVLLNYSRNGRITKPWAKSLHVGPKVLLMDEYSASDGDLFPYRFRVNKLGKLIGKRTWGGVVGISGSLPIIDGGYLMKPEFAPLDVSGKKWIIEGEGVEPDIVVDNHPSKEFQGVDEQLLKGLEVLKEQLEAEEFNLPEVPKFPIK